MTILFDLDGSPIYEFMDGKHHLLTREDLLAILITARTKLWEHWDERLYAVDALLIVLAEAMRSRE